MTYSLWHKLTLLPHQGFLPLDACSYIFSFADFSVDVSQLIAVSGDKKFETRVLLGHFSVGWVFVAVNCAVTQRLLCIEPAETNDWGETEDGCAALYWVTDTPDSKEAMPLRRNSDYAIIARVQRVLTPVLFCLWLCMFPSKVHIVKIGKGWNAKWEDLSFKETDLSTTL